MTVVFTDPKCRWSAALLQWMLQTISTDQQNDIHLLSVSLKDDVTHVPCIIFQDQCFTGLEQCKAHLLSKYASLNKEEPSAPGGEPIVQRDLSQYQTSIKAEANLEDKFNQLLAERSKGG